MTITEAEQSLSRQLEPLYGTGEASGIAALVMEHLTGHDRLRRRQEGAVLDAAAHRQLESFTARLLQQEPVQYVLGESWFYGMRLYVDRHVLIPRPETEELVDWIVREVRASGIATQKERPTEPDATTELKILDVGTGSGCIALALKKALPRAEVWGCDCSEGALNVARRNGAELDIRVDFVGLDFLDAGQRRQLPSVDLIVSNPPYIPEKDKASMHPNVLEHEPHTALFVPDEHPLLFYEALADFAHHRLHRAGSLYVEIHEGLGADVVVLLHRKGFTDVVLKKDMQGKDRMIRAGKLRNTE
ncbi:MAG TPA: peptide chain release factor N(5)-glutamine methyltransferase [Chitinophagaceae bacterium]|jgi:release factor glutamine methyltransferase|nr:peptide chain release factor N(5)-glutamine methyltransferase [Chitinophagaceae bacterium]